MSFNDLANQHSTSRWWQRAKVRSYADALALYKKARNPAKGKPVTSWSRLYMRQDDANVYVHVQSEGGPCVGYFSPDNKFTFVSSEHDIRQMCAPTLASSLYRAIPFMWQRVGLARYRVEHTGNIGTFGDDRLYMDWRHMRSKAPEYFAGLSFDLTTGQCLNRRPDISDSISPDNRKVWLRSLRKFKYGMKARGRVGIFATVINDISKDTKRQIPDWAHEDWQNLLYTSIKETEFPLELMRGFIATAMHNRTWVRRNDPLSTTEILDMVDAVCKTYSIDLRRRFGVFDEVSNVQGGDEVSRHKVERHQESQGAQMAV